MDEPTADGAPKHDALAALRQRSFQYYSASRIFATLGQSLMQAVLAWQVYHISGSALSLGLLGLVRFFPALSASMIGGLAADTFDRRKVMIASQVTPFACSAVLAISTHGGWVSLDLIFGLVVLLGLSSAFEGPARQALLPAIVRPDTFANAVTMNNIVQKLGSVTGPTLAGFIIAGVGIAAAYSFYCGSILVAIVPLLLLRYAKVPYLSSKPSWQAIKEGITFVRERQVLLGAMTLDMFAVIFGGAAALLPVYATDILHAGPAGYGLLSSSLQIGAFVMAFALVVKPPVRRTGRALVVTVILYGVLTMLFGLSREFAVSIALYALLGAADQLSVVMRQTTIQMATPDELRGRVSAVNQVFVQASNQIGAMESGFVAAVTTATFAVVSGGAGAAAIAALVGWRMPRLWAYEVSSLPVTVASPASDSDAEAEEEAVAAGVPP